MNANASREVQGVVTVRFARTIDGQRETHEVDVTMVMPLPLDELHASEFAWDAVDLWEDSDWGTDNPTWWCKGATLRLPDGETIEL